MKKILPIATVFTLIMAACGDKSTEQPRDDFENAPSVIRKQNDLELENLYGKVKTLTETYNAASLTPDDKKVVTYKKNGDRYDEKVYYTATVLDQITTYKHDISARTITEEFEDLPNGETKLPKLKKIYTYNTGGELTQMVLYQGSTLFSTDKYNYNNAGKNIEHLYSNATTNLYQVDSLFMGNNGLPTTKKLYEVSNNIYTLKEIHTYAYDNMGNLTKDEIVDPLGKYFQSTVYEYDKFNNITSKKVLHNSSVVASITDVYKYDAHNNWTERIRQQDDLQAQITYRSF